MSKRRTKKLTPYQRAIQEVIIETTPLPPDAHSCQTCDCWFFHATDLQAHLAGVSREEDRSWRWKPAKYGGEYIDTKHAKHLKADIEKHISVRGEYVRNGLAYEIMHWQRGPVIVRKRMEVS